jgi:hypothetical protein
MFRPNRPSSGVQVVMVKDSAAHCNVVFFPSTDVASGYLVMWVTISFYLGVFGLPWLILVLFGLLVAKYKST